MGEGLGSLPAGAPGATWRDGLWWLEWSPASREAELAGLARLSDHPARPEVVRLEGAALGLGPAKGEWLAPLPAMGTPWEDTAPVGVWLRRLVDRRPDRVLVEAGLARRHVDRLLNRQLAQRVIRGPAFGGQHPGWVRDGGGRAVVLRWREATTDGFPELDQAAFGVFGDGPDPPVAPIFHLAVHLREAAHDPEHHAELLAVAEAWRDGPVPELVRVELRGPPWLDPRVWLPPDGLVPPARARWLLHTLDGRVVGGVALELVCDPALRAGRRPPPREPQAERRRRLFSRWDQGVRVDEEGLWSATPEALADELVAGARGHAVDATCGVGSLALALARRPEVTHVTAVDVDPDRLAMARHNAGVYGVEHRIRFVYGESASVVPSLGADVLVVDPPWGGRDYPREGVGLADLGMDLASLWDHARDVRLKLPPSFRVWDLPEGFEVRPAVDVRGVLKFLVARRGR